MQDYAHLFHKSPFIYLNAGTAALTPRPVLESIQKQKLDLESNPTQTFVSAWSRLWEVQQQLAQFVGARPEDLFLRSNVTFALNDLIMALPLPKDSEIVVTDMEYGAIANICRRKAELEGLSVRAINLSRNLNAYASLTPKSFADFIDSNLTSKTKMMLLSHVTTGTGCIYPVERVAELCRDRDIHLVVDGAHAAGIVDLDFQNTNVSLYGANLHKWVMGPKGTGFGWIAPRLRDQLRPKFGGWTSYDINPMFKSFGNGDPIAMEWMIASTQDFSPLFGIADILVFWKEYGKDTIRSTQSRLRKQAKEAVQEATGWTCVSDLNQHFIGPMATFLLPDHLQKLGSALMNQLYSQYGLQIAITNINGQSCLRVSPHIHNTEDDILKASEILQRLN